MNPSQRPYLSSFGRNRGRSLSAYQQRLVEELLPQLEVRIEELQKWGNEETVIPATRCASASARREAGTQYSMVSRWIPGEASLPNALRLDEASPEMTGEGIPQFPNSSIPQFSSIALEIGFGAGEHLLAQAAYHPETLYVGCEPYINGVAKCLAGIDGQKLTNIRIFTGDARIIIEQMAVQSVDEIFLLFPDPWPKLRHNKRRLINHKTLEMLARIHKSGGRLLLATDHEDYCAWMLEHLLASPYYAWTAREQADWKTPPVDWTQTKYQRKTSAQGRPPVFLECVRK